jgi:transcription termination factor NusB
MWNKVERFVLVTGIYNHLMYNQMKMDTEIEIDWDFIANNCLYLKENYDLDDVKNRFKNYFEHSDKFDSLVKEYLTNLDITPLIVIAILITFFLEIDESSKRDDTTTINFLGKYPRLTQELIAGEYTSLINAIIRKVAADLNLVIGEEKAVS